MTALQALHRELGLTVQETLATASQRSPEDLRKLTGKYIATIGPEALASLLKVRS